MRQVEVRLQVAEERARDSEVELRAERERRKRAEKRIVEMQERLTVFEKDFKSFRGCHSASLIITDPNDQSPRLREVSAFAPCSQGSCHTSPVLAPSLPPLISKKVERRRSAHVRTQTVETIDSNEDVKSNILRPRPTMRELLALLKAGGGVKIACDSSGNSSFLATLDVALPELDLYRMGRVQTSPGIEEIAGSPTEYYRTVGAIIALLSVYACVTGESEFGLELVSAGDRGPMSLDAFPGKFINMGTKPELYKEFCSRFAEQMHTEDDWWAMLVLLAIHDVGKCDEFRARVNAKLQPEFRTDDHDRALAQALDEPYLISHLMPSVGDLSRKRRAALADGFATNFQLPQLGQGEVAAVNLRGLLDLPSEQLRDGTLRQYLYHSIFDIAGATCSEKFIFPLALEPVYVGFGAAMSELIEALQARRDSDETMLYFKFLYPNFQSAYADFEATTFRGMCGDEDFCRTTGIALLRLLAMTRNTYKNPDALFRLLQSSEFSPLVEEMAGTVPGPKLMLYYGPDMLRMGIGATEELLVDATGSNMRQALLAIMEVFVVARVAMTGARQEYQFQVNVHPIVATIKHAGASSWPGGESLRNLCRGLSVSANEFLTEGLVVLNTSAV
jgi:hypothetical protein